MRRLIGFGLVVLAVSSTPAWSQSTLLGAKGKFSTLFSNLEWEPGYSCSKPSRPYRWTEYEREAYLAAAKRYLDCIKRQADSDAEYAAAVVYEGYEKAAEDFVQEAQRGY